MFMWGEECLQAGDRGAEEDHSNLPAQKLAAFVEHEVLSTKIDTLQGMRQKTVDTILGMKEMLRQGATANAMLVCKCEHVLADVLRDYQSQLAATEQRKLDCSQDEGIMVGKGQGRAQPGDDCSCTKAAHGLVQQARRPAPSTPVPSPGIPAGGGVCFFSPRARADTEQLRRRFEAAINEANHSRNYSFGDG